MGEEKKITRTEKIKIKLLQHITGNIETNNCNYDSSLTIFDIPDEIALMVRQSTLSIEEAGNALNKLIDFFYRDINRLEEESCEKDIEISNSVDREIVCEEIERIVEEIKEENKETDEKIDGIEKDIEECKEDNKLDLLKKDLDYNIEIKEIRENFIDRVNDAIVEFKG